MLTREQILEMPAGAEVNKLIAEQVLCLSNVRQGWFEFAYGDMIVWEENNDNHPRLHPALLHGEDCIVPSYSSSIAAAWQVVEVLRAKGGLFVLENTDNSYMPAWRARFDYVGDALIGRKGLGDTPALAICQAALLTLLQKSPTPPTSTIEKTTPKSPIAMTTFIIRLEAAAATCDFTGAALPALSEEFTVEAADRKAALKASRVKMTLPLMGQTLTTYIDGTEERGSY
jgi:hypothetical protein